VGGALARARRADKAQIRALAPYVPYWFVCLVLFGFSAFQIVLNPFGFSDLTHRYTQDIADLLVEGPYLYPTTGRDTVSVALVDDTTLSDMHMPWPWSYGAQARVLDSLLAYRPRAVIVDLLFVDPRNDDTLKELIDEVRRYRAARVPLYFEGSPETPDGPGLRPELAATGVRVLDPTVLVNQGVARQYPAQGQCFAGHAAGCRSLAISVYDDLYASQPVPPLEGVMELVWGTATNPINAKWMRVVDENGVAHACGEHDGMGWARRILLAFFDPSAVRALCPYTGVIPVEALLAGRPDADIDRLARGRIVFYGASLEGAQDRSFTPVNGLLANVFVHAMALDNLVSFRGSPQQNVVSLGGATLDSNTMQLFAIVPVILVLGWPHVRRLRSRRTRRDRDATSEYLLNKATQALWHGAAFALGLAAGAALMLAARLSVANWGAVAFISVELAALLLIGLPETIWGYLHHVAGGVARHPNTGENKP
jgi:hypothetical protein